LAKRLGIIVVFFIAGLVFLLFLRYLTSEKSGGSDGLLNDHHAPTLAVQGPSLAPSLSRIA
jgi:hypothetical protein